MAAIDRAGRRCEVCRTGRRWRELTVVRRDGVEPVVMCAACRARYGDAPPARTAPEQTRPEPARPEPTGPERTGPERTGPERTAPVSAREEQAPAKPPEPGGGQGEDRVRKVLSELPKGEYSTGRIAKAAGLNHAKTVRRLHQLAASGEIRQVGKRWSTEPPPSELDQALDRLQARTSNIRIVRDRSPVG